MNPIARYAAIACAVFIPTGLGLWQCEEKNTALDERDAYRDKWQDAEARLVQSRDSTGRFKSLWQDAVGKAAEAKEYAFGLAAQLESATQTVRKQVDGMSRQNQRITALTGLVANKTLPDSDFTRLSNDSLKIDPELIRAVAKTTTLLTLYQGRSDSLLLAVGTMAGEKQAAQAERDRAVQASIYAEGQFVEEAATKRFLGIGRKRASLNRAAAVRRVRVTGEQ